MTSDLPASATASPSLYLVGIGIGGQARMTNEAKTVMASARRIVHLTPIDAFQWTQLAPQAAVHSLSHTYAAPSRWDTYLAMKDAALAAAIAAAKESGYACFAMYGHPLWFVSTARMLREQAHELGISVQVVPGISSLDTLLIDAPIDVGSGALICDVFQFLLRDVVADPRYPLVLMHFGELAATTASVTALVQRLEVAYPADHLVHIVRSGVIADHASTITSCQLKELAAIPLMDTAGSTLLVSAAQGMAS